MGMGEKSARLININRLTYIKPPQADLRGFSFKLPTKFVRFKQPNGKYCIFTVTNHLTMPKVLVTLLLALCCSSCATIYSGKSTYVTVSSNANDAKARIAGNGKQLPAEFKVQRSAEPLMVELVTDSVTKEYAIPARLRPLTKFGNILWGIAYPLAFYVDKYTERGYYYGDHVFLDSNSQTPITPDLLTSLSANYYDTKKGLVNYTTSIPLVNNFDLHPRMGGPIRNTGLLGLSAGLEYYYKDDRYFKLGAFVLADALSHEPQQYRDGFTSTYSIGLSLTQNRVYNRLSVGYGINYAQNAWIYDNQYPDNNLPPRPGTPERIQRATASLGLQLNAYYRVGKQFHIGIVYNPYVYDVAPSGEFNYQHTISLDLLWKLRLWK
jgi:hypothetical protein